MSLAMFALGLVSVTATTFSLAILDCKDKGIPDYLKSEYKNCRYMCMHPEAEAWCARTCFKCPLPSAPACSDIGVGSWKLIYKDCRAMCGEPAAQTLCRKTCGYCEGDTPVAPLRKSVFDVFEDEDEEPTELVPAKPEATRTDVLCHRESIKKSMTGIIAVMVLEGKEGHTEAVKHCLDMENHLENILSATDEVLGIPDFQTVCSCLSHFDAAFVEKNLNCVISNVHALDVFDYVCPVVGERTVDQCDMEKVAKAQIEKIGASEWAKAKCNKFKGYVRRAYYKPTSDAHVNTDIACPCLSSSVLDSVFAAKNYNCQIGTKHLMDLYLDVCPAVEKPCDLESLTTKIQDHLSEDAARSEALTASCQAMADYFKKSLDPITTKVRRGNVPDLGLMCECIGSLDREFVDENLRCGVSGHLGFNIWKQCSEQSPACEAMGCHKCDASMRCHMHADGVCRRHCLRDGSCFDDPAKELTCNNYRSVELELAEFEEPAPEQPDVAIPLEVLKEFEHMAELITEAEQVSSATGGEEEQQAEEESSAFTYGGFGKCTKMFTSYPVGGVGKEFDDAMKAEAEKWCQEKDDCVGFTVLHPSTKKKSTRRRWLGRPRFCKKRVFEDSDHWHYWEMTETRRLEATAEAPVVESSSVGTRSAPGTTFQEMITGWFTSLF